MSFYCCGKGSIVFLLQQRDIATEKCDIFIYLLIYQAQREHKMNIAVRMRNCELNWDQNLISGQMAVQNWMEINSWTALVQRNLRLN